MTFKKIDAAALAGEEPVDGVLQGIDANIEAAYTARPRRISHVYPADNRPVIGCADEMTLELLHWPISPGCTQIKVTIPGSCLSALMRLWLVLVTDGEPVQGERVTYDVGDDYAEMTLDVSGYGGTVLDLRLGYQSRVTDTVQIKSTVSAGVFPLKGDNRITTITSSTLSATKRYAVRFTTGATADTAQQFGGDRTAVYPLSGSTSEVWVWPPYAAATAERIEDDAVFVELLEMSALEVYGWTVEETAYASRADLGALLRPGDVPAARLIRRLHQRVTQNHERTRIHHGGNEADPGRTDVDGNPGTHTGAIVNFDAYVYFSVDTYDAATTYTVTINGVDHDVTAAGDAASTIAGLVTAINASTADVRELVFASAEGDYLYVRPATNAATGITSSTTGGTGAMTRVSRWYKPLLCCQVGSYVDDRAVVDGDTSGNARRSKLRLAGTLYASAPEGAEDDTLAVDMYVTIVGFSGSTWTSAQTTGNCAEGVRAYVLRNDADPRTRALRALAHLGDNIYVSSSEPIEFVPRRHALRGCWPLAFCRRPWLQQWVGEIDDTGDGGSDMRLLRLYARTYTLTDGGARGYLQAPIWLHAEGVTVWTDEVVL